ncbi:MAG TPA: hypothetical protein PKC45_08190 [Gemmatales bacterium]|nr:hypothetical protein [Gemmatales bacterium]
MRKTMFLSAVILIGCAGLVGLVAWWLLCHVPHFYREAAAPPGPDRQAASRRFESQLHSFFVNDIRYEAAWQATWDGPELNSWLAEDFVNSNLASLLPAGLTEPRLVFRYDCVLLGFQWEVLGLKGVVNLEFKIWLAPRDPNVIIVQIERFQFGAVPLAIKLLQDEFGERIRQQNVKVLWYRHLGRPTVVLRLQADQREPSIILEALEVADGRLTVKGRSLDPELRGPVIGSGSAANR